MSRRCVVALVGAFALVLLIAAPAGAHVTVTPESAPSGSDAILTFNVPNEIDDANVTKVEIGFPQDHPIADVSILPTPGWTATVSTVKVAKPIKTDEGSVTEAVGTVTWTGGSIGPGNFAQFTVSVGLPDASSLSFPAVQTYSDGTIVRWVEPTPPGGEEPEHPAPVLTLTKGDDTSKTASSKTAVVAVPKNVATTDDVDSAKTIGIIGIVLGALGLIVGIGAFFRKRTA